MPKPPNNNLPRLLTKSQYFAELTEQANKLGKGDRVAVMTMAFAPQEPEVIALLEALGGAARRGVDVLLSVDAYGFLAGHGLQLGPLIAHKQLPEHLTGVFAERQQALSRFKAQGGRVVVTNPPTRLFTSPVAGRSHIKFGVINDKVWIGGCNLDSPSDIDLMAQWQDKTLADWLVALPLRAEVAGSVHAAQRDTDTTLPTAWGAELHIDAGIRKQSRIMQQALQLVDEAEKHILLTCQFFPSRIMARHLARAIKRGVKVELIYNHPNKHQKPRHILHHATRAVEQFMRPGELFAHELPQSQKYIHAKLLVTEKAAMLGSHNYVEAGVQFGTAEVALLSHDRAFAANAEAALRAQLN
jgi:phosphatidylserine/phosphatidylglycerophosphate/cardiolipin synthase-like enzyme